MKPRQPFRESGNGANSCQMWHGRAASPQIPTAEVHMAAKQLKCRECATEYPLEARYVCSRCFGPLEVAYEHEPVTDVGEVRRRIQGGPQNIWRYTTSCRSRGRSRRRAPACPPAARRSSAPTGSPSASASARCGSRTTRTTRRTPSRTASSSVAATRARELGFDTLACASTGNLANSVAAHAAALGMDSYVLIPADLEEQKQLATGDLRHEPREGPRQLRRRQPALHRALGRPRELGVREHQHAPVLRRGLEDRRLRDRRAARLGAARPLRRADRLGLAVHEDRQGLQRVDRGRPRSTATSRS